MRRSMARRRGFTLVEMLVVIIWLTVLLSTLVSLAWSIFRIQAVATESFEALSADAELADRFRDDVAQAVDAPEFAADFQSSPICLILSNDRKAIMLYRFVDGHIERVEIADGGTRIEPFRAAGVRAEFARRGRLVTLTFRDRRERALMIAAALGGARS